MPTGFYPIAETKASYTGVLLGSLVIQELIRIGVWYIHRYTPAGTVPQNQLRKDI